MSTDRDLNSVEVEPSEYLQKRRHQAINDLRERVYRARDRAYDAMADGYNEDLKREIIRAAVENYITELEPVLVNTEQGQEYWQDVELGTVDIYPPNDGRNYREYGYEYEIVGLIDFQNAPKRFDAQFTYETNSHAGGQQVRAKTVEVAMPEHISWTAFRYANQFAYDVGLDLEHKEEIAVEAEPF